MKTLKNNSKINGILSAIENVTDKRINRMLQAGALEDESAFGILPYLKHLKIVWKNEPRISNYISGMIAGYSAELKLVESKAIENKRKIEQFYHKQDLENNS